MQESNRARDNYSRDELIRFAYMAGRGASARDIARALRTTPFGVYSLCKRHGVALVEKANHEEEAFPLIISRQHFDSSCRIASANDADPVWFLSRVVRVVLSDKDLTTRVVERIFK